MFTLGDVSRKGARIHGASEALVFEGTRLTYRGLDERVNRLANVLMSLGAARGERIAILAENTHEYIVFYLAAAKAGLAATPLNFRLSESELVFLINDSEAAICVVGDRYEDLAQRLRLATPGVRHWIALEAPADGEGTMGMLAYEALLQSASPDDPRVAVDENEMAILMYTGGTTGSPKGVMLSHRNLLAALMCLTQQYGFTAADVTCMVLPLFHVSFWPVFCNLFVGGKAVIVRRAELGPILEAIESERCTHLNAVPTLYNWLLDYEALDSFDLSSLRLMTYAGSPIPPSVLKRCIAKFGRILAQGYGLTEAAPMVTALMPDDHQLEGPKARLLGSVGKEGLIVEIQIRDESGHALGPDEVGEVAVRGPNVMMGYWKKEQLTREKLQDGWLLTGDVGRLDDEGYLYLVDRKADMIVTGGENVYPAETENVLYLHPAVRECAVVSAPDEKWGERVQAVVVLREGATATEDELVGFCKDRLAGYKCPKAVGFWDALPTSPVGKILRKDIKKTFWDGHDRLIG